MGRSAVLFYLVSFLNLSTLAALPSKCHEKSIMEVEVFNGYYHPVMHHLTSIISSSLVVFILSVTLTIFSVPLYEDPFRFLLAMFLTLNCSEALAKMVTHLMPNYVVSMVLLVSMFGFYLPLLGFMLVPSEFPHGASFLYNVPFFTYSWRSIMYLEFYQAEGFDSDEFPSGMDVLKSYEIENVNYSADMIILFSYYVILQSINVIMLCVKHTFFYHGVRNKNLIRL